MLVDFSIVIRNIIYARTISVFICAYSRTINENNLHEDHHHLSVCVDYFSDSLIVAYCLVCSVSIQKLQSPTLVAKLLSNKLRAMDGIIIIRINILISDEATTIGCLKVGNLLLIHHNQ